MKKLYFIIGLGLLLSANSNAQSSRLPQIPSTPVGDILAPADESNSGKIIKSGAKGGTEVFFSEDFSNGFAGQGANGAWTNDGVNGNLWFQTFPVGATDGYNPNAALPAAQQGAYGLFLPNYFGTTATIASPTAANGFMMMDADRYNSTRLTTGGASGPFTTSNPITTMLVSPIIDLTAVLGQPAILTFSQKWRMCCTDYSLYLQVTLDGGATWITGTELNLFTQPGVQTGTGGPSLESVAIIDLSTITTNASDLSDFRFRIVWEDLGANPADGSTPSHYYFMIDDIEISGTPQNELVVGSTYINDYFFIDATAPDVEYVNAFEYWDQPAYLKRPFNFIAEVINSGTATQTGVVLTVEFEDPSTSIEIFTTEPTSIAPGDTAFLSIDNVVPTAWEDPANGIYVARYTITQDQEDQFPGNNIGLPRTTRINSEDDPGAIFQNDRNVFTNIPLIGQDVIFANRFAFTETDASNLAITHIDYVLSGSSNGLSQVGEAFYLNVRSGSVFEAEGPDNVMTRYFGDDECDTVIEEGTLTTGANVIWISYELPSPVLIEPNVIYQGEIEVPASAEDIVFPTLSNLQEPLSGVLYNFASPQPNSPQGWGQYGPFSFMIRFRTNTLTSVNNISYESGIKITQNWPNPFVDETKIQFQLDETANVTFELHDVTGKLVHIENLGLRSAMSANVFTFPRRNLEAGVYTYSIVANGERVTRKMIVE